ncbi:hypothetical protein [Geodermatophilus sp. URMC 63]
MTRSRRRVRRLPRRALAAVASAVALLTLGVVLPGASARFSSVTANPAGAWVTDGVAPPAGLAAAQTCAYTAITSRAATSATAQGSLTLPAPAGTRAGDVLLAQVGHGASATPPTEPPGWTLVRRDSYAGGLTSALYWKKAVDGEGSATFAFPAGSTVTMAGGMAAYSGVSTTDPIDTSAGTANSSATVTTPAVTTTTAGTELVRLTTSAREAYPAPGTTTQRWRQLAVTGTGGVSAGDEPFPGPGTAPGVSTAAPSGLAAAWVGQTVALRRAPGTPSASLAWTASASSWATGYRLERSASGATPSTRSITPIGATGTTEDQLQNGTTYAFRLWAYAGTWTSAVVGATLTPSC